MVGSDGSDTISPLHREKFAVTDASETFMSITRERTDTSAHSFTNSKRQNAKNKGNLQI
jgi:hypothetical protein